MKNTLQANGIHSAHERNLASFDNDAEVMILSGKFKVETGFFEIFESRLNDILPYLVEGIAYSPLELIGEDMWADITTLGQRQAVLSLKHMATLPGSQLREVEFSGSDLSTFELRAAEEVEA